MNATKSIRERLRAERKLQPEIRPLGEKCPTCDIVQPPRLYQRDHDTVFVNCAICRGRGKGDQWQKR